MEISHPHVSCLYFRFVGAIELIRRSPVNTQWKRFSSESGYIYMYIYVCMYIYTVYMYIHIVFIHIYCINNNMQYVIFCFTKGWRYLGSGKKSTWREANVETSQHSSGFFVPPNQLARMMIWSYRRGKLFPYKLKSGIGPSVLFVALHIQHLTSLIHTRSMQQLLEV